MLPGTGDTRMACEESTTCGESNRSFSQIQELHNFFHNIFGCQTSVKMNFVAQHVIYHRAGRRDQHKLNFGLWKCVFWGASLIDFRRILPSGLFAGSTLVLRGASLLLLDDANQRLEVPRVQRVLIASADSCDIVVESCGLRSASIASERSKFDHPSILSSR